MLRLFLPDGTRFDPDGDREEQLAVFIQGHWSPLWLKKYHKD